MAKGKNYFDDEDKELLGTDEEFDFDDLDDFDSSFDSDEIDINQLSESDRDPVNKSSVTSDSVKAMGKGMGSAIGAIVSRKVGKEFPETRGLAGEALNIATDAARIKDTVKDELGPSFNQLRTATRRILPRVENVLPKKLYEKLDKKLTPKETASVREGEQIDDVREAELGTVLGEIFTQNRKYDFVDKTIDRQLDKTRHYESIAVSDRTRMLLEDQIKFNRKVYTPYLKKSLELKYRSLYVAQDILEASKGIANILTTKLDEIRQNTSLPEIQKQKLSEGFKENLRDRHLTMASSFIGNMFGKTVDRIKEEFISPAKDMLDMVAMPLEMMADSDEMEREMAEMGMGSTKKKGFLGTAAPMVAKMIGATALGAAAKKPLERVIGSIKDKYGEELELFGKHGKLQTTLYLEKLRRGEGEDSSALMSDIVTRLFPDLDLGAGDIRNQLVKEPDKAVNFDEMTRTSIVEIIPGYLSQLLKVSTDIRDGRSDSEQMHYDPFSRRFLRSSELTNQMETRLFNTKEIREATMVNSVSELRKGVEERGGNVGAIDKATKELSRVFVNLIHLRNFPVVDYKLIAEAYENDDPEYNEYVSKMLHGVSDKRATLDVIYHSLIDGDGKLDRNTLNKWTNTIYEGIKQSDGYKAQVEKLERLGMISTLSPIMEDADATRSGEIIDFSNEKISDLYFNVDHDRMTGLQNSESLLADAKRRKEEEEFKDASIYRRQQLRRKWAEEDGREYDSLTTKVSKKLLGEKRFNSVKRRYDDLMAKRDAFINPYLDKFDKYLDEKAPKHLAKDWYHEGAVGYRDPEMESNLEELTTSNDSGELITESIPLVEEIRSKSPSVEEVINTTPTTMDKVRVETKAKVTNTPSYVPESLPVVEPIAKEVTPAISKDSFTSYLEAIASSTSSTVDILSRIETYVGLKVFGVESFKSMLSGFGNRALSSLQAFNSIPTKALDYIRSVVDDPLNALKDSIGSTKDKVSDWVSKNVLGRMNRSIGKARSITGRAKRSISEFVTRKLTDIYRKDETDQGPLVTRKELIKGLLKLDGSVLSSVEDIDGPLFDPYRMEDGSRRDPFKDSNTDPYMVITQDDVDHGLVDKDNRPITKYGNRFTRAIKSTMNLAKSLVKKGTALIGGASALVSKGLNVVGKSIMATFLRWPDVYVLIPGGEPVLRVTGKTLRDFGIYSSGDRLEDSLNIDEPVYHVRTNEVLIGPEDIEAGLVDKNGNPLTKKDTLLAKLSRFHLDTAKSILKGGLALGKAGLNLAREVGKSSLDYLFKKQNPFQDVYRKGEIGPSPLLLGKKIEIGNYAYFDGTRLTSCYGISEPVYEVVDGTLGNQVITKEDINTGLVNVKGESLDAGQNKSRVSKLLHLGGATFSYGIGKVKDAGKAVLSTLGSIGRGIKNAVTGKLSKYTSEADPLRDSFESVVGKRLDTIISILKVLAPDYVAGDLDRDGDRDNSYEDYKQKKAEGKTGLLDRIIRKGKREGEEKGGGIFGSILSLLGSFISPKGLLGRFLLPIGSAIGGLFGLLTGGFGKAIGAAGAAAGRGTRGLLDMLMNKPAAKAADIAKDTVSTTTKQTVKSTAKKSIFSNAKNLLKNPKSLLRSGLTGLSKMGKGNRYLAILSTAGAAGLAFLGDDEAEASEITSQQDKPTLINKYYSLVSKGLGLGQLSPDKVTQVLEYVRNYREYEAQGIEDNVLHELCFLTSRKTNEEDRINVKQILASTSIPFIEKLTQLNESYGVEDDPSTLELEELTKYVNELEKLVGITKSSSSSTAAILATAGAAATGSLAVKSFSDTLQDKATDVGTGKVLGKVFRKGISTAKLLGRGAVGLGALMDTWEVGNDVYDKYKSGDTHGAVRTGVQGAGKIAGGAAGALTGAKAGALLGGAIGSIIPIGGTAIGAAIGGIVGGAAGYFMGSSVGSWLMSGVAGVAANWLTGERGPGIIGKAPHEWSFFKYRASLYGLDPVKFEDLIDDMEAVGVTTVTDSSNWFSSDYLTDGRIMKWCKELGIDLTKDGKEKMKFFTNWWEQILLPVVRTTVSVLKLFDLDFDEQDELSIEQLAEIIKQMESKIRPQVERLSALKLTEEAAVHFIKYKDDAAKQYIPSSKDEEHAKEVARKNKEEAITESSQIPDAKDREAALSLSRVKPSQPSLDSKDRDVISQAVTNVKSNMMTFNAVGGAPSEVLGGVGGNTHSTVGTPLFDVNNLGELSSKYESGSKGSLAIGYDVAGGTSYGKYQIASGPGRLSDFVKWAAKNGGDKFASRMIAALGQPTGRNWGNHGGKHGPGVNAWNQAIMAGELGDLEHQYIKSGVMDDLGRIKDPDLKALIASDPVLMQVFWSASVQYGSGGVQQILKKAYRPGMTAEALVKAIYSERIRRAGLKSDPSVYKGLINRFKDEEANALASLRERNKAQAEDNPSVTTGPAAGAGGNITTDTGSYTPEFQFDYKIKPSGPIAQEEGFGETGGIAGSSPIADLTTDGTGKEYTSSLLPEEEKKSLSKIKKEKPDVDIENLHPSLRKALAGLNEDFMEKFGHPIQVNSGFRSLSKQKQIYDKEGPSKAAKPSTTGPHTLLIEGKPAAIAFDAQSAHMNKADKAGLLAKWGLERPLWPKGRGGVEAEPWHVQLQGLNKFTAKEMADGKATEPSKEDILKSTEKRVASQVEVPEPTTVPETSNLGGMNYHERIKDTVIPEQTKDTNDPIYEVNTKQLDQLVIITDLLKQMAEDVSSVKNWNLDKVIENIGNKEVPKVKKLESKAESTSDGSGSNKDRNIPTYTHKNTKGIIDVTSRPYSFL